MTKETLSGKIFIGEIVPDDKKKLYAKDVKKYMQKIISLMKCPWRENLIKEIVGNKLI